MTPREVRFFVAFPFRAKAWTMLDMATTSGATCWLCISASTSMAAADFPALPQASITSALGARGGGHGTGGRNERTVERKKKEERKKKRRAKKERWNQGKREETRSDKKKKERTKREQRQKTRVNREEERRWRDSEIKKQREAEIQTEHNHRQAPNQPTPLHRGAALKQWRFGARQLWRMRPNKPRACTTSVACRTRHSETWDSELGQCRVPVSRRSRASSLPAKQIIRAGRKAQGMLVVWALASQNPPDK